MCVYISACRKSLYIREKKKKTTANNENKIQRIETKISPEMFQISQKGQYDEALWLWVNN